ncbi:hypothetical protein M8494_03980 [Serratia ureilytica]
MEAEDICSAARRRSTFVATPSPNRRRRQRVSGMPRLSQRGQRSCKPAAAAIRSSHRRSPPVHRPARVSAGLVEEAGRTAPAAREKACCATATRRAIYRCIEAIAAHVNQTRGVVTMHGRLSC